MCVLSVCVQVYACVWCVVVASECCGSDEMMCEVYEVKKVRPQPHQSHQRRTNAELCVVGGPTAALALVCSGVGVACCVWAVPVRTFTRALAFFLCLGARAWAKASKLGLGPEQIFLRVAGHGVGRYEGLYTL